ncbi:MAG: DHH family phosphoesterase, partial [Planctomycetes bacterium]|nr:DHH family phosphoesterase [Planctomycetota bacterium]
MDTSGYTPAMSDRRDPTLWQVARPETAKARSLALELGTSTVLAQVLLNRGIEDPAEARAFLEPDLAGLPDPALLPDAAAASRRIREAVERGESVVVWGDYDADGVSGTAMLVTFLRLAGTSVRPYLPDRTREGYGFNEAALCHLAREGTNLVIAVDHGTTAVAEIAAARREGMDVVVLDHHTAGDRRPDVAALVNPCLATTPGPAP